MRPRHATRMSGRWRGGHTLPPAWRGDRCGPAPRRAHAVAPIDSEDTPRPLRLTPRPWLSRGFWPRRWPVVRWLGVWLTSLTKDELPPRGIGGGLPADMCSTAGAHNRGSTPLLSTHVMDANEPEPCRAPGPRHREHRCWPRSNRRGIVRCGSCCAGGAGESPQWRSSRWVRALGRRQPGWSHPGKAARRAGAISPPLPWRAGARVCRTVP